MFALRTCSPAYPWRRQCTCHKGRSRGRPRWRVCGRAPGLRPPISARASSFTHPSCARMSQRCTSKLDACIDFCIRAGSDRSCSEPQFFYKQRLGLERAFIGRLFDFIRALFRCNFIADKHFMSFSINISKQWPLSPRVQDCKSAMCVSVQTRLRHTQFLTRYSPSFRRNQEFATNVSTRPFFPPFYSPLRPNPLDSEFDDEFEHTN